MGTRFRVTVENRDASFEADADRMLLDSADDSGVVLPRGCRVGACLNCAARLLDGHVSMRPDSGLTPELVKDLYFLPCVAAPRSDLVIEAGTKMGLINVRPWLE